MGSHSDAFALWGNGAAYRGGIKDGLPHGKGRMTLPSGDVYEGRLKTGMRHGHGKQTMANGGVYEGQWHMHARQGHGKHSNGVCVYEGQWHKDRRNLREEIRRPHVHKSRRTKT